MKCGRSRPPEEGRQSACLRRASKSKAFPTRAKSSVETYLAAAELLGQRTAEMHLALASDASDPAFAPEPFTMDSQQALEQSMSRAACSCVLVCCATR